MSDIILLDGKSIELARQRYAALRHGQPADAAGLAATHAGNIDDLMSMTSANLLRMGTASNLFVWQNVLLELSAYSVATGDPGYAKRAYALFSDLAGHAELRRLLPEEIHRAFYALGLIVLADTGRHVLSRTEVAAIEAHVCGLVLELCEEASRAEWGKKIKKRNAWNHTIIPFSAIGAAGCVIDHPDAQAWRDIAVERTLLFFQDGVTDAGMTREGLAYCGFVFRNLGLFLRLARRVGVFDYLDAGANPYLARISRIPEWYAHEVFPSGSWVNNLNDSYWDPHPAMRGFLMTFGELDPRMTQAVWSKTIGAQGQRTYGRDPRRRESSVFETLLYPVADALPGEPAQLHDAGAFYCTEVGYAITSVPDGRGVTRASFNCGEFIGAIHDQADNGAFTFFARNVPIVIDSGAANDPVEGSPSSTTGHNGILIDGAGQLPSGKGRGVTGRIVDYRDDREATVIVADLAASYNTQGHNPVRHARRTFVFRKTDTPYLLWFDDVDKDGEAHNYEFVFHTPAPERIALNGSESRIAGRIAFSGAATDFGMAFANATEVRGGPNMLEEGFESKAQPPFEKHSLFRVAWNCRRLALAGVVGAWSEAELRQLVLTAQPQADGAVLVTLVLPGGKGTDRMVIPPLALPTITRQATDTPQVTKVATESPTMQTNQEAKKGPVRSSVVQQHAEAVRRLVEVTDYPAPEPTAGIVMANHAFREIGQEFLELFLSLGRLKTTDNVLDVGCGGGRMAAALGHYLAPNASYVGFDIHEPSIRWCKENLSTRWPNFHFDHFDLTNPQYNRSAKSASAANFVFPYQSGVFDFIILTSVFTHMFRDECTQYLRECARVLKRGGTIFCTAYLLNEFSTLAMLRDERAVQFKFPMQGSVIHDREKTNAAIAHFENAFRADVLTAGLTVDSVAYGRWSSNNTLNTKQDVLILRHI